MSATAHASILSCRSFDAAIDVSPYKGSELLEVLRELGVPTVLCGQLEGHPYRDVFSTVYSDDEEGGRFAALAMKDRGRKDIVAVLGPQDNPAVIDRLRGYRAILGESLPDENVIYTGWSSGDGYQATRRLLAREIHADGVLCGSDRIATGVIAAFNEAGISVPKDVSVVGFDDHEVAARSVPALTTIRQPLREEGRMAAGIALDMINGAVPTTTVMHMAARSERLTVGNWPGFPLGCFSGKPDPFRTPILGCTFRQKLNRKVRPLFGWILGRSFPRRPVIPSPHNLGA